MDLLLYTKATSDVLLEKRTEVEIWITDTVLYNKILENQKMGCAARFAPFCCHFRIMRTVILLNRFSFVLIQNITKLVFLFVACCWYSTFKKQQKGWKLPFCVVVFYVLCMKEGKKNKGLARLSKFFGFLRFSSPLAVNTKLGKKCKKPKTNFLRPSKARPSLLV